jgi:hypothetical protein
MISELQAYSSTEIMAGYTGGYTFRVNLVEGQTQSLGLLSAGVPQNEGEVVIITDEEPDEAAYGRDLSSPADGTPDGVDLNGDGDRTDVLNTTAAGCIFPLDLNGDGDTGDTAVVAGDLQVVPVVVIIRWRSFGGRGEERRVQMMTVTGKHRP